MKKICVRCFVLTAFCAILPSLFFSCADIEKLTLPTDTASSNTDEGTSSRPFSSEDSLASDESDAIRDQFDLFEFSKATFESVNDAIYADYLVSEECKTGEKKVYFFESEDGFLVDRRYLLEHAKNDTRVPLFIATMDGKRILLGKELTERFTTVVKRTGYGFNCIFAAKDRVHYIFGSGHWLYIYTFDGKRPKYYFKEGDRNAFFPREESLGGNWYFVKTGG